MVLVTYVVNDDFNLLLNSRLLEQFWNVVDKGQEFRNPFIRGGAYAGPMGRFGAMLLWPE